MARKDGRRVSRPNRAEERRAGPGDGRPPHEGRREGPQQGRGGEDRPRGSRSGGAADTVRIYGFHAVREALRSKHREILRVVATAAAAEKLAPDFAARQIQPRIVEVDEIVQRLGQAAVHQGVMLEAKPLQPIDISEIEPRGIVLVLDQVTDPHNVGAIVRTAAAYAVTALVTTERNTPEFAGVLAKSASGGLEHVPLVSVVNLSRAMEELGDMGFLRVGLDSDGPASLEATSVSSPVALVLGAEGKGLRRLTREKCDLLARLDMPGAIRSLNVSNACAVALTLLHHKLTDAAG